MREEQKDVQEFKYLGSSVQSNGEFVKEVIRVCKTARRAAVLFGFETVALRKREKENIQMFGFRRKQIIGCGDPRNPKKKKKLKLKLPTYSILKKR